MRGFGLDQRGVSEIISGLIMISALFGLTTFVLVHKAQQGSMRAEGLVTAMEQAERRQAQLIDFSYADEQGGDLRVYLSNYGWENAKIDRVWVGGTPLDDGDWTVRRATTGANTGGELPKREFCYVKVPNFDDYTSQDKFPFAILTKSDAIYKREVSA